MQIQYLKSLFEGRDESETASNIVARQIIYPERFPSIATLIVPGEARTKSQFLSELISIAESNQTNLSLLNDTQNFTRNEYGLAKFILTILCQTLSDESQEALVESEKILNLHLMLCGQSSCCFEALQVLTGFLADQYSMSKLTSRQLEFGFRAVQGALRCTPSPTYIYLRRAQSQNAIQLMLTGLKWPFTKGLSLWSEFELLNRKELVAELFTLSTDQGVKVQLLVDQKGELKLIVRKDGRQEQFLLSTAISLGRKIKFGVHLQPQEGFFSSTYKIKVTVDQAVEFIPNCTIKINSSSVISEATFLRNIQSKFFWLLLQNKTCEDLPEVNFEMDRSRLDSKLDFDQVIKDQSTLGFFAAQRTHGPKIINYCGNNKLIVCFRGSVCQPPKVLSRRRHFEMLLPFVYLFARSQADSTMLNSSFASLLDILEFSDYSVRDQEILLYFCELVGYRFSQQLLDSFCAQAPYASSYIEKSQLQMRQKQQISGQMLPPSESDLQPFEKNEMYLPCLSQIEDYWFGLWTQILTTKALWPLSNYRSQSNSPFSHAATVYSAQTEPNKQAEGKGRITVQWEVANFITNQEAKPLLQPILEHVVHFKKQYRQLNTDPVRQVQFYLNSQQAHSKPQTYQVRPFQQLSKLARIKAKLTKNSVALQNRRPNNSKDSRSLHKQADIVKTDNSYAKPTRLPLHIRCLNLGLLTLWQGELIMTFSENGGMFFKSTSGSKRYDHMCLQPANPTSEYRISCRFRDIKWARQKRFNQKLSVIQLRTKDGKAILFYFPGGEAAEVQASLKQLVRVVPDSYEWYLQSTATVDWLDHKTSNFQYLMDLNVMAGRSYSDLTQYPVLPWAIVGKGQFRDFSRNMGNLGSVERTTYFKNKFETVSQNELFNEYHFGSHYSSPAAVLNYLVRLRPYSLGTVSLQSGSFDCADRTFSSYLGSWINACTSPTDVRELIPELYFLPEVYLNVNNYDFGLTQEKNTIDNIELPLWANANPYLFAAEIRKAFQSEAVSKNLHKWIDLIFGFKQRGLAAVEAMNIFFPLTYENAIDLDSILEKGELISMETQIAHYGQTPSQIIGKTSHPARLKQPVLLLLQNGVKPLITRCILDKTNPKQAMSAQGPYQSPQCVLGLVSLSETNFVAVRQHDYFVMKVGIKGEPSADKEAFFKFTLQSEQAQINYSFIQANGLPVAAVCQDIVLVGGYYDGFIRSLNMKDQRFNGTERLPVATITSLNFDPLFHQLILGDSKGFVAVYNVEIRNKVVVLTQKTSFLAHQGPITSIIAHQTANLYVTSSVSCLRVGLYNLYSHTLIRYLTFQEPVAVGAISFSPLYSIVVCFAQAVLCYSLNGQFISRHEIQAPVKHASIRLDSNKCQVLMLMLANKDILVFELPQLRLLRHTKLQKDGSLTTCGITSLSGYFAVLGLQNGAIQILFSK